MGDWVVAAAGLGGGDCRAGGSLGAWNTTCRDIGPVRNDMPAAVPVQLLRAYHEVATKNPEVAINNPMVPTIYRFCFRHSPLPSIALFGWMVAAGVLPLSVTAAPPESPPGQAKFDQAALLTMLRSGDPKLAREAAEQLEQAQPKVRNELVEVADAVKAALSSTRDSAAECALRLALARLALAGIEDAAEWGFESMSVTHTAKTPREVFAAHVQALEMVPGAAKELMIGNIDVALNFPEADPKERQRIKEFVTLTAEAMQTRELAVFLDALLLGDEDLFVKLEAPLEMRLLRCYRNVKSDPPAHADAILTWLEKHPRGPLAVEIAALETVSLVGTTKPDAMHALADRVLAKPTTALILVPKLKTGELSNSLLPQVQRALERHLREQPTDELRRALAELQQLEKRP